jgi:hypothetical protein
MGIGSVLMGWVCLGWTIWLLDWVIRVRQVLQSKQRRSGSQGSWEDNNWKKKTSSGKTSDGKSISLIELSSTFITNFYVSAHNV